jgi:hypothetical protein
MKLMNVKTLFLIGAVGILLSACQKEVSLQNQTGQQPGGGTNNTAITGDWNFVGSNAKTYVALSFSEAGQNFKTVTTSDYNTQNNVGTLKVTDKQFIFKGISHTVNDVANSKTYINGLLMDDTDAPFNATYPVTDQTMDYIRNNNDSLTFTNAFALMPDPSGGGTPVPAGPVGAKISVVSDTLTVITYYNAKETVTQAGVPATFEIKMEGTMKFKRK